MLIMMMLVMVMQVFANRGDFCLDHIVACCSVLNIVSMERRVQQCSRVDVDDDGDNNGGDDDDFVDEGLRSKLRTKSSVPGEIYDTYKGDFPIIHSHIRFFENPV